MDMKIIFLRNLLLYEISVQVLCVWCYGEELLEITQTHIVKFSVSILDAVPFNFCQLTINWGDKRLFPAPCTTPCCVLRLVSKL